MIPPHPQPLHPDPSASRAPREGVGARIPAQELEDPGAWEERGRGRGVGLATAFILLALAALAGEGRAAESSSAPVDFNRDIRPILSDKCFFCHGPDEETRDGGLRLDLREAAIEAGAIVPGDPGASLLLERVAHQDPGELMPPPKAKIGALASGEVALLSRWIAQGAEYQLHWSFVPVPEAVDIPLAGKGWARGEIDRFVAAAREARSLEPAPECSPESWLRRASFDLTGLPPALEEIDAFLAGVAARGEAAYAEAVEGLLASPAYGERMAGDWLDQARYADTFGYQADRNMHVWPWRDWVIRAFNDNLPWDQFITWQTAGDLLPDATRDQILATTFNRLHRQTNEGGSIDEEFRVEYVNDRVTTSGTVFLGLTLDCSRCHDHKYDPISMRDYYALSAFFNNIDESGLYSHFTETAPTPALPLPDEGQEARLAAARERLAAAEAGHAAEQERARARHLAASPEEAVAAPEPVVALSFDEALASGGNRVVPGRSGQALEFSGDDPLDVGDESTADFSRTQPFSVSLWLKPAAHRSRMVVFHRSRAAEDSAFRGYELLLYEGKPTVSLVHFWPGDALRVQAGEPLPLNEWTHLALTYDGSSRASGLRIYRDGRAVEDLEVIRDSLTRDITHRKEWGDSEAGKIKLQLAGRFRDIGFGGGAIDEFAVYDRELSPLEAASLAGQELPPEEKAEAAFLHHALRNDPPLAAARGALRQAREAENDAAGEIRQIMVMRDLPGQRPAYLLHRGMYDQRGDAVGPDTPAAILPFPEDAPRNRLGLARWLTHPGNPLVARVTVNRLWTQAFGQGLVGTPEDFGSQGEPPTHPELLDWMARSFMDSGWDVQALLRAIVLSSAYRQSSVPADSAGWTEDPGNQWLARGPRHRFSAEQIRDNALAASGLLVPKLGGPPVNPYELASSFKPVAADKGEGLYRRSLYTYWKRTAPPPALVTFDATAREVCTPRRESTATPLQALVLLNGPQYVEAARALAERLLLEDEGDDAARLARGFRLCTSRAPDLREQEVLLRLIEEQRERFRTRPEGAAAYLATGQRPAHADLKPAELAAWTAVAQALLNHDETSTKR